MKLKSPFKLEQEHREEKSNDSAANPSSPVVVGLRILTHTTSLTKSNVLLKPAFKITLTLPDSDSPSCGCPSPPPHELSCFLKSCQLCRKKLSLDKEVYMYRGDQGFCSTDCRERQIVLDEMRELQLSTKRMIESPRHCSSAAASGRREVRLLIEDLRRRNQSSHQNQDQNHWAIVS